MQELYVYYKVAPAQVKAARAEFELLRAALSHQWPELRSRLLMRPAAPGAVQTWMEIHAWPMGCNDAHSDFLSLGSSDSPNDWVKQLERHAGELGALSVDGRHVEVFVALD